MPRPAHSAPRDLNLEVDPRALKKLDAELTEFVDELFAGLGRKERVANLGHYVTGLLLDGDRKEHRTDRGEARRQA